MEKGFAVKFSFAGGKIETEIHQKGVTPHEAVGLLEVAKQQILNNVKSEQVFRGVKKDE